jgi:lycopene cyclase domain-containing protein
MYTVLAVVAVGLASIVDQLVLTTNLLRRKAFWTAYAIVFGFQLLVNGVLTGVPVVRYNPADITGVRFVYAPIEDLLFGFSMVLFTLTLWVWAGRRDAERARP